MSVVNVSKSFVAQKQRKADYCHRCGGLMVPEKVFEIGSIDWHCVSCGERIDPVILAHRQVHPLEDLAREDAEKLSVDRGNAVGKGASCHHLSEMRHEATLISENQ